MSLCSQLILLALLLVSLCQTFTIPSKHLEGADHLQTAHHPTFDLKSPVEITWKAVSNSSYGLLDPNSHVDGSEFEVDLLESGRLNKKPLLIVSRAVKSSSNTSTSNTTSSSSGYSDKFARNKMFPLAAAAYSDMPEQCLNSSFANATLYRKVNITCDNASKDDICAGFTALSHTDKAIIIAFRGTSSSTQLKLEASGTVSHTQVASPIGGLVSFYFMETFSKIWVNNSMAEDFRNLSLSYPDYELWITGHSLGGALASIAASQVIADGFFNISRIKLYTMGQPRTGDKDYADALDQKLDKNNSFRITHSRDVVVHIPAHSYKNYTHHRADVWYSNDMLADKSYTSICLGEQEDKCSGQVRYIFSVNDHLNYFGKRISFHGISGCVSKNVEKKKKRIG